MTAARHDLNRIELVGDELALTCECDWRSPPSVHAATVGVHWDEHRRQAGVPADGDRGQDA